MPGPLSGPVPKRDEERRRANASVVETTTVNIAELAQGDVEIPAVNEEWHPIAQLWYGALSKSGMAIYYEPSDWAMAYVIAEDLSRELMPKPISSEEWDERAGRMVAVVKMIAMPMPGAKLAAILKAATSLMATEGDRRRLRIELNREKQATEAPAGGNVVSITKNRMEALGG